EENIIAALARVHERRFADGLPRGDQIHAAVYARAVGSSRARATVGSTRAHRLVLIDILQTVGVLRHERDRAVEEQSSAVREIARLIHVLCDLALPSWNVPGQPVRMRRFAPPRVGPAANGGSPKNPSGTPWGRA